MKNANNNKENTAKNMIDNEMNMLIKKFLESCGYTINDSASLKKKAHKVDPDSNMEDLSYTVWVASVENVAKEEKEEKEAPAKPATSEEEELNENMEEASVNEEAIKEQCEEPCAEDYETIDENADFSKHWQIVLCGDSQYSIAADSVFPYNKKVYFFADTIAEAFEEFYKRVTKGDFKLKHGFGYKFRIDEDEKYSYQNAYLIKGEPTYLDVVASESYDADDYDSVDPSYIAATNLDIANKVKVLDYKYRLAIKSTYCCNVYRALKAATEVEAIEEARAIIDEFNAADCNIPCEAILERIDNHNLDNVEIIQHYTIAAYPDGSGFGVIVD